MNDKIIKLKSYERMEEAMLDQSVLSRNNISSSISNSMIAEILPMLPEQNFGIVVNVFEKDFEKAWEILKEYHQFDE
ncbi:MAG: hypothetical protein BGO29_00275 [Bacteroidales bacterium 36-12]|nr:MAG: hypothetical protein BGO29_00275 [Bacteroidales bacterium 36-12]